MTPYNASSIYNVMRNSLFVILFILVTAIPLKAQKLAAGLDPLWLATGIAKGSVEMTVGRSSTLGLTALGISHPWVSKEATGIAIMPELRYFLSGRPMFHHFVGVNALSGTYSLYFNDKHYIGSAAGIGVTFGYILPLTSRWNIDLHSGLCFIHTQDREQGHNNLTLPIKVGLNISYILR